MSVSNIVVWNIEKATHKGPGQDFKREPVAILYSEDEMKVKLRLAIAQYCEQFDDPVIDNSHWDDVLVYDSPNSKYPYTEFWTYSAKVSDL